MEKNTIELYDNKVWGIKVSTYGLENGYLDYLTLAKIVGDRVLNNNILRAVQDWELATGEEYEENGYYRSIFQFYIITESGFEFLRDYTDEIVYYSESLDIHLWCITHFGTSWDYVLTDVKLV